MIKRYFYIFSTTLFILTAPNMGVKASTLEKRLNEMERQQKAPPGFSYQAVLRDSNGDILANESITLRLTVQTAADGGTVHWEETHAVTTNAFGLVNVVVGDGTKTGGDQATFDEVPWQDTQMFLKVEVNQGAGFTEMGTEQFQFVPYAMAAANGITADQATKLDGIEAGAQVNVQADWNEADNSSAAFIQNKPTVPTDINELADADGLLNGSTFDGSFNSLTDVPAGLADGDDINDADADPTNELQSLDFTNDIISLTNDASGAQIDLSNFDQSAADDFDGDFGNLANVPVELTGITDAGSGVIITDAERTKLAGIADGAEVNVQPDWAQAGDTEDDFIQNKPTNVSDFTNDTGFITAADLAFTTDGAVVSNADPVNESFVVGSMSMNDTGDSDHFRRMFFDKITGAFRVGIVTGPEWDNLNRGVDSFAGGRNNVASGSRSFVGGGSSNTAGSQYSFVGGGDGNTASGVESVVVGGDGNTASGPNSFVGGGRDNNSSGNRSTIGGGGFNFAAGNYSGVGSGNGNLAQNNFSFIGGGAGNLTFGISSTVSGGSSNHASGNMSAIPGGTGLTAETFAQTTIGLFNTAQAGDASAAQPGDRLLVVGNGTDGSNRSDALVMLKNGDTDINGALTANSLEVEGAFTLPNTDGTSGQVLSTDGAGNVGWADAVAFSTASQITSNSGGDLANDSFLFGATQFNDDTDPNHDNRMFFEKGTGAFRLGGVDGDQWDNRGNFSFANGFRNSASGNYASVLGGNQNSANGVSSTISGGADNTTDGDASVVGGGFNNTTSANSHYSSIAGGFANTASGRYSSIAGGQSNTASGYHSSIPGGRGLLAESLGEVALGMYNSDVVPNNAIGFSPTDRLLVVGNGTTSGSRSDALVMLKNGDTDINGALTANSLEVEGAFMLPNTDGTNGQVLSTDGGGNVSWADAGGGAFSTAAQITSNSGGDLTNDSFVFGSTSLDDVAGTNDNNRMLFDKTTGAFRVGSASGTEWNGTNKGNHSFAGGVDNIANGTRSAIVGGSTNNANGGDSFVGGGSSNTATGFSSAITGGSGNQAIGANSFIGGGSGNSSSGVNSVVGGGNNNTSNGSRSFVGSGSYNYAGGIYSSIPGGTNLTAESWGQVTLGTFNTPHPGTPNGGGYTATDRLLVVGNGQSGAPSDALVMLKNGDTDVNGALTANSLEVEGAFLLPNTDGTNGQVLSTDGTGNVGWTNGGAFSTASQITSNSNGDLANDSFVFGSADMDNVAGTEDDIRMFFDKEIGAFRIGIATGTQWNNPGNYSFSSGRDNVASGHNTFIGGGVANSASGINSSISGGRSNSTPNTDSFIGGGSYNSASGFQGFIGAGSQNTASGISSVIGGGRAHVSSGNYSAILGGRGLLAESWGEVALGTWNTDVTPNNATAFDSDDRLLVVGNGQSSGSRSDALVMLKNGNTTLNGQLTLSDGTSPFTLPNTDGSTNYVLQTNGSGTVTWVDESTISSDRRLKTNIKDLTNVLEKLSKLEGYRFNWNEVQNRNTEVEEIGLIAQEVQKLYPELVSTDSEGYLRVKYISFVPLLLEAVKELQAKNAALAAENDTLEAQQANDEKRFTELENQVAQLMKLMLPTKETVGKN